MSLYSSLLERGAVRRTGVESFGSDAMLGEDHFYPRIKGINLNQELFRILVLENWAICELPLDTKKA